MTVQSPAQTRWTVARIGAVALLFAVVALAGCATPVAPMQSATTFDAPDAARERPREFIDAASYRDALATWTSVEDVNGWIGARFEYDRARALRLSESQRQRSGSLPIHTPEAFFARPSGICVDLARFGVESVQAIDPAANPKYLMIEFAPATLGGETLRLHWMASFVRDGRYYYFADSKRPGEIAGPYPSPEAFITDYARMRERPIVAFRETSSYQRRQRAAAPRARAADPR